MGGILIIDEWRDLLPALQRLAPQETFHAVPSVAEARRRMVTERPKAVLFTLDDFDSGVSFARSLRDHPNFSMIPFFLFREEGLSSTLLDTGDSFISFCRLPFTDSSLRADLGDLLPLPAREVTSAEGARPGDSAEELFLRAQRLLAQVLHNLKTSNLLDMLDPADLPDTLLEITRKICENEKTRPNRPDLGSILKSKKG